MQVCNDECSARLAVKLSVAKNNNTTNNINEQKEKGYFSHFVRDIF